MPTMLMGLFKDADHASKAIDDLKNNGYNEEISVIAYDKEHEEVREGSDVPQEEDSDTGKTVGAVVGGVTGALALLFSGIAAVAIPGIGVLVGGPLAAALGLTGGVVGSLGGGLIGGLVDLGIDKTTAERYDEEIHKGQILVGVSAEGDQEEEAKTILNSHGATDLTSVYK